MSRHRTHIRPLMLLEMNLCWISLLITSYSRKVSEPQCLEKFDEFRPPTEVYEYVVFQGMLYGIGGGTKYASMQPFSAFQIHTGLISPLCILYMFEWFFERRDLANGILFAGDSLKFASLTIPLRYGY